MIKFFLKRHKLDNVLYLCIGKSSNYFIHQQQIDTDHPAGKNVTPDGGPVEVILSTMAEFEMMKSILFSQKMMIEKMRCCQNCRKNYEDEKCVNKCEPNECADFEKWEPIP